MGVRGYKSMLQKRAITYLTQALLEHAYALSRMPASEINKHGRERLQSLCNYAPQLLQRI